MSGQKLKHLDLFSGIGGFSLGLERTGGFETVAFCEIEPYCQQVLNKHWPEVLIHDDIRTLPRVEADIITGGFPCQPFSTAARGRNNAPDMWGWMLHTIGRCHPVWVVAENVPGIGADRIDTICNHLEALGYSVWPIEIDTALPQRQRARNRILWLAHANRESESRRPIDAEVACLSEVSRCRETHYPGTLGVDAGLPHRMDRLRALGNAVVPQIVELIGRAILSTYPTNTGDGQKLDGREVN